VTVANMAMIIALSALVLDLVWFRVWKLRRDSAGTNRVQVAGDNSTLISGTNITITATNGSLAAHTIDGDVTVGRGKASVSPRRADITRDGQAWGAPPICTPPIQAGPVIRPQTPWERQLAAQQEGAARPDDQPGLAAVLAGLYRAQSIAATLKMGPAVQHVGELPTWLTVADKNTLFYDENERCGYLWDGSRFLIEGAGASSDQPEPPEFLLSYTSPIPVREFKATNSCPRCGWVDAHYLHTTDLPEGATIGRECTNCKQQWGEK